MSVQDDEEYVYDEGSEDGQEYEFVDFTPLSRQTSLCSSQGDTYCESQSESKPSTTSISSDLPHGQYRLLSYDAIVPIQRGLVQEIVGLLNVSSDVAEVLLQDHKWNKEKLEDSFFTTSEVCLEKSGLSLYDQEVCNQRLTQANTSLNTGGASAAETVTCPICYGDSEGDDGTSFFGLGCNHAFCKNCFKVYLETQVGDGPSCIRTTCPQSKCDQRVPPSVFKALCSEEVYNKYRMYLTRNFIEVSKVMKYCPAAKCDRVAVGNMAKSVDCDCGHTFCFRCGQEFHEPSSCAQLAEWLTKCNNESETANWILVNTKKCPKCATRIEKNQGCNHMTCRVCRHEFCWICIGDWKSHGSDTGGYYKCNRFEADPGKQASEKAKADLDRYIHYYQRYHGHSQALKFAATMLENTDKKIYENSGWISTQYLRDAVELVIKCRKILKYTYVMGFAIPDEMPEKRLFEYHQEMLEKNTEKLQELTEVPVNNLDKHQIVNLTRATQNFLDSVSKNIRDGFLETSSISDSKVAK